MTDKNKIIYTELMAFHKFCQEAEYSNPEMVEIWSPLLKVKNKSKYGSKHLFILIGFLAFCYLVYGLMPDIYSSMGRIFLIKLLPLWDWRYLFNEQCLFENPYFREQELTSSDCLACEWISQVDVINNVSYSDFQDVYLRRDAPVIVTDGIPSSTVNIANIIETYFENLLPSSSVCKFSTNLRVSTTNLLSFFEQVTENSAENWFAHWQNCYLQDAKILRKFYKRPYFIPKSASPEHSNWVLVSKRYQTNYYKKINVGTGIILVFQLKGDNLFKLVPHPVCQNICSELQFTLHEKEILAVMNTLWDLEYIPGPNENLAIVTETYSNEQ